MKKNKKEEKLRRRLRRRKEKNRRKRNWIREHKEIKEIRRYGNREEMRIRKEKEGEAEVTSERIFGNYVIWKRIRSNVRIRTEERVIRNISLKISLSFERNISVEAKFKLCLNQCRQTHGPLQSSSRFASVFKVPFLTL